MKRLTHLAALFLSILWTLPSCISSELQVLSSSEMSSAATQAFDRLSINEKEKYHLPASLITSDPETAKQNRTSRDTLTFSQLMRSVESRFPLILAAMETSEIASGEMLAAQGGYDLKLKSAAGTNALGYYQNEIANLKLEQPFEQSGATLFGGYKLGLGDFGSWDDGMRTNENGEFSAGVRLPLLAGRTIDKRRLALWKARISQDKAQPIVLQKRLEVTKKAASSYWKWVAAGKKFDIAQRLLALAEKRHLKLVSSATEGEIPRLVLVENRRLIVERKSILIRSNRLLEQSAIALSLYWRTPQGTPQIPTATNLPGDLPNPQKPSKIIRANDLSIALINRPELHILNLQLKENNLKIQKAKNDTLPQLDLIASISKDYGAPSDYSNSKGPVEAGVFLQLEIPLQQRKARGAAKILSAKKSQIHKKKQFASELVIAEVKDNASALRQSWLRIAQARENLELASEIEQAERAKLAEGDSDLLRVNLREQQTAKAAASLVNTITEHFMALAYYRASLGIAYTKP